MVCAQAASFIIMLPSKCCADKGIVANPKANCNQSKTNRTMSLVLELMRMRGSNKRRCKSTVTPINPKTPATPPLTIAIICFDPASRKFSYTKWGVNMPNRWPKNKNKTPTWNKLLPMRSWPALRSCDESLFQVYWSRSKRIKLPTKKTVKAM